MSTSSTSSTSSTTSADSRKAVIEKFIYGTILYDDSMRYYLDPVTKDNVFTLVCGSPICKPIHLFHLKKWKVDLEHVNAKGQSGLHSAIMNYATVDIFKTIVNYLPTSSLLYNLRDHFGNGPVHICCGMNSKRTNDMLKILCEVPTVDINIKTTTDGFSALHIAVKYSNYDAIRILSKYPKLNPNIRDQFGKSPIFHAMTLDLLEVLHECFGSRIDWQARDIHSQTVFDYMMLQRDAVLKHSNEFEHLFRFLLRRNSMTNSKIYNWDLHNPRLKACAMWKKLEYFIKNKPFGGRKMTYEECAFVYNKSILLQNVTNSFNLGLEPFVHIPREFWFQISEQSDTNNSKFLFDIRELQNLRQNPYTNKPFDKSLIIKIQERLMFLQTHRLFMKDFAEFKIDEEQTMVIKTQKRVPDCVSFFAEKLSYVSVTYLQSKMSLWAMRDIYDFAQLAQVPHNDRDYIFATSSGDEGNEDNEMTERLNFLTWLQSLVTEKPAVLIGVDYGFTRRLGFEECCCRLAERLNATERQVQVTFEPFDMLTKKDLEYIIRRHYIDFNLNGMSVTQNRLLQKYVTVEFLVEHMADEDLMADMSRHIES